MEMIPNIGLGPLRFGMSPKQVQSLLDEPETYEDWMGGNLNDSLLFKGMIIGFDVCDTYGPLPDSEFCSLLINMREDVVVMGKRLLDWNKTSLIDRLNEESVAYELEACGDVRVPEWCLAFSFDDDDRLIWVVMWTSAKPRRRIKWLTTLVRTKLYRRFRTATQARGW